MLLGLLLTVYVAVAAVNYSVVQSYIGTAAGDYFSKEWGGKVRIGSLGVMPLDHVILHEVLLVAPDGDTVLDCGTLRLNFKRFPFKGGNLKEGGKNTGTLSLDRVYLGDAYYHLAITPDPERNGKPVTNLQFIIDCYKHDSATPPQDKTFTVEVGMLTLNHVHYKMDLIDKRKVVYENGVQIPHMEFYDICGRIKGVHVVNDDVEAHILHLSTEERSGFVVKEIRGDAFVSPRGIHAHNMDITTGGSHIMLDADLVYDDWDVMDRYEHTVHHHAVIHEGTTVAMSDVAYWAPVLWGYDVQIDAEGDIEGPIDSLVVKGLHLGFGHNSRIAVEGLLKGLPDVETARADLDRLDVRVADGDAERVLAGLPLKLSHGMKHIINNVRHVDMTARVHGGMADGGTVNLDVASGMGNLRADLRAKPLANTGRGSAGGGWSVGVEANSDGLGLSLLGSEWLTHSGLALSAEAEVGDLKDGLKAIDGVAEVELTSPVVRGNRLDPININGSLKDGNATVEAASTDTLLRFALKARGALGDTIKEYLADVNIERLDASAFRLLPKEFKLASTRLHATAKGNTADSLTGSLELVNTKIGAVRVRDLRLDVESEGERKAIGLQSDPMEATVTGYFDYGDLPVMVRHMLHEVVPEDLGVTTAVSEEELADLEDNSMVFNIQWNDDGRLLEALGDKVAVARGTRLNGSYNSRELVKMVLRSDSVRIGSILLDNFGLGGRPSAGAYVVNAEAQEVFAGRAPLFDRLSVTLNSNQRRTLAELYWGEEDDATRGDLMLRLDEGRVSVVRPDFYIGNTHWTLGIDSLAIGVANGFEAEGKGISAASDEQRVEAAVELHGRSDDNVMLDLDNFDLQRLCEVLLQGTGMDVAGSIGGHFSMYGLTATPYFNSNLTIANCMVNRQPLGDVKVRSNWNAELNILNLQLGSDQIHARGWMGLGKREPDLNFSVDFNRLELALMAPLMSTFTSRFEGQLQGTFDVSGTTSKPDIEGEAVVENGALKVDITGVTYFFDDSIRFRNKQIMLEDFMLHDTRGNMAAVDGTIRYNSVQDIELDLSLHTDNLLVLDKKEGEQFYGTLLAKADGTVHGSLDKLAIDVSAQTNPGCSLTVPVNGQKQMQSQNYITFVGDMAPDKDPARSRTKKATPFTLGVDLSITPDLKLNLPMDFSEVKVGVGATGNGDLHMDLDEREQPQVVGSYEIVAGTMKLSMMSLFEKNFTLESGSNLAFQGSVPDARFDLRAVYSQRANLSTLTGSLSAVDNTQKYIQVENVIAVAGTLQEPTIGFDLRLPNADASVEDEVFAYIDRNSERDMINQTMSLLLMGQFYNVSGNDVGNGNAVNNGLSSGYSMMASSVSSIVSDMVQFVDVDVNYKAATELTNQQVDVNISKDWGRWYLESTLGYGGESRELEASTTGGTVIDALIGYRINPLVHIFAYNRTNTNDYTRMDLPYKQGIGLKLTKDFDRWDEMLGLKAKKKNKKKSKKETDK